jgi:hypothetical protein
MAAEIKPHSAAGDDKPKMVRVFVVVLDGSVLFPVTISINTTKMLLVLAEWNTPTTHHERSGPDQARM